MGQGAWVTPPETFVKPGGAALERASHPTRPVADDRGAFAPKGPSPRKTSETISYQQSWQKRTHLRDKWLLPSRHHPPLAMPFLGPNPVIEINPQGVGLRASPCRRADSAPLEEGGPNAPGDVCQSLALRGPVARGMVPRLQRQEPNRCPAKMHTPSPPPSPPRSWSRSSSSRQAMAPSARSPPMKSTATRSRSWPRSTRGNDPPRFHKRLTRRRRRASCRSAALAHATREAFAQRTLDGASPDGPSPQKCQSQRDRHKVRMMDVTGPLLEKMARHSSARDRSCAGVGFAIALALMGRAFSTQ